MNQNKKSSFAILDLNQQEFNYNDVNKRGTNVKKESKSKIHPFLFACPIFFAGIIVLVLVRYKSLIPKNNDLLDESLIDETILL